MKKLIFFGAILMLFPVYSWGYLCKSDDCPKERPYLIDDIRLDYFYPPKMELLQPLQVLSIGHVGNEYFSAEIPEYSSKFGECPDEKSIRCQRVKKVDSYRKKILQEKKIIEVENQKIAEKNKIIQKKNDLISQYRDIYKTYSDKIEKYGCPLEYIDPLYETNQIGIQHSYTFEATDEEKWLDLAESLIQMYEKMLEENRMIRERNLKVEKENAQIEQKNVEIEKQFQAYYSPEKMLQLFNDYEKAISEKCVGCDYSKPLDLGDGDCKKCPNREFVNGKCVLKQNDKKGVTK